MYSAVKDGTRGFGVTVDKMSSAEAWSFLAENPDAILIDVRTQSEWSFVGVPELTGIGRQVVLMEWQHYPTMEVTPDLANRLTDRLREVGAALEASLLFICRSGA